MASSSEEPMVSKEEVQSRIQIVEDRAKWIQELSNEYTDAMSLRADLATTAQKKFKEFR